MLRALFGRWPLAALMFGLLLLGVGFYRAEYPETGFGYAKGLWFLGGTFLVIWLLGAFTEKEDS